MEIAETSLNWIIEHGSTLKMKSSLESVWCFYSSFLFSRVYIDLLIITKASCWKILHKKTKIDIENLWQTSPLWGWLSQSVRVSLMVNYFLLQLTAAASQACSFCIWSCLTEDSSHTTATPQEDKCFLFFIPTITVSDYPCDAFMGFLCCKSFQVWLTHCIFGF